MTVVHTYFYIVVDTQRGCRTLKVKTSFSSAVTHLLKFDCFSSLGEIFSILGGIFLM